MTDDVRGMGSPDPLPLTFGWDRLARIFSGDATADDQVTLAAWIGTSPARRALIDELREVWRAAGDLAPSGRVDARWENLQSRIASAAEGHVPATVLPLPGALRTPTTGRWARLAGTHRPVWSAIAAVILLAAGAWISSRVPGAGAAGYTSLGAREVTTRNGQRASLTLGDGTHVLLDVGSTLRVADGTGRWDRTRDVYLAGEAFFDVRHDAAHPFVVHTTRGVAEDLGTRFDVRAYPGDAALRVAVREGSVAVAGPGATRGGAGPALHARDVASVTDSGLTVTHDANVDALTGWTRGELVFRDAPLRQALAELARWYDVDVTLTDGSAGDRPVSESFRDASLAEVLDAIAASAGLRWVRSGRAIAVSPRTPNSESRNAL